MNDRKKLNLLGWAGTALIVACLIWNAGGESLFREVFRRIERKTYYEQVIAPRGLSLREAEFWEPAARETSGRDSRKP